MTDQLPPAVEEVLRRKSDEDRIVLVGASSNPEKYGNIILENLRAKGYSVVPVNPGGGTIAGLQVYPSVQEVPPPIGLVNFVVPPAVTKKVLTELVGSEVGALWFQDGSFDDEVIAFAEEHFDAVVHHACIMVVSNFYA